MKVKEAISKRRSIRKYSNQQVLDDVVKEIIQAGIWAPSGLNNQPWKFIVIKEQQHKQKLAQFTKYGGIIINAPVCVCVFLDKAKSYDRDKDVMAVGACIQNMLLCAHELGIGTCWMGEILNKKDAVGEYLRIDRGFELMAVISMGYPLKEVLRSSRRKLESFFLSV
ncbi:MAG: nitroreductase [Candidatus Omnitrophica bacterium]|nr:nitroreductase [Candidatus Omnitrophota bacterium]